ncbi:hypothetical protein CBS14141_000863 [Malassezia furfur]|nr:hypothetical protein CBS14141_000863 [Malassezia furfur]
MADACCDILLWSLPCRWGGDMCPCCNHINCCGDRWRGDKPLPTDDYRQEARQRELELEANRRLYDEEATVSSGAAYPTATPMAAPTGTAVPMNVPAAGTQQHITPPVQK